MASLGEIPPWLRVTPDSFVHAGQEGAESGLGAAHVIQAGNQMRLAAEQHAAQLEQERQRLGQQSQLENARLSQQQHLAEMEMQARKEIAEQNHLRLQQENLQLNAYRQAEVGLRRAELDRRQALNDAVAREKAKNYADEQGLADWIAKGGSMASGLAQFPGGRGNAMALKVTAPKPPLGAPKITHTEMGDVMTLDGSDRYSLNRIREPQKIVRKDGAVDLLMPDMTIKRVGQPTRAVDPMLSGGVAAGAVPIPPSAATPASGSPFKEGQRIRNKKDGGIYVIQNGVPVPASTATPAANVPAVLGEAADDSEEVE